MTLDLKQLYPEYAEAMIHKTDGAPYVLVDDALPGRKIKAIDPKGVENIYAHNFFEEEPDWIPREDLENRFTPEQLAVISKLHQEEKARERVVNAPPPRAAFSMRASQSGNKAPSTSSSRAPRKKRVAKPAYRRPSHVSWSGGKFAIYRHKIEPLGPKDTITVEVDGEGAYEFTKEQFLRLFSDIFLSATYKETGFFAYPETPEKVKAFKKI